MSFLKIPVSIEVIEKIVRVTSGLNLMLALCHEFRVALCEVLT